MAQRMRSKRQRGESPVVLLSPDEVNAATRKRARVLDPGPDFRSTFEPEVLAGLRLAFAAVDTTGAGALPAQELAPYLSPTQNDHRSAPVRLGGTASRSPHGQMTVLRANEEGDAPGENEAEAVGEPPNGQLITFAELCALVAVPVAEPNAAQGSSCEAPSPAPAHAFVAAVRRALRLSGTLLGGGAGEGEHAGRGGPGQGRGWAFVCGICFEHFPDNKEHHRLLGATSSGSQGAQAAAGGCDRHDFCRTCIRSW